MQRAKSLLSETIQHKFGDLFCIAYPGPLAVTDTNGETLHFIGEVSFRIVVEGQSSMMSAWVTNDIEPGLLALGSDIPEDLGLQLYDIPDASTPSGHAEDTATIKDPRGGAPVTRSEKYRVPAPKISYTNNHPSDNFLIPFRYGFHREVVQSAKGTYNIYYHTYLLVFVHFGMIDFVGHFEVGNEYLSVLVRLCRKVHHGSGEIRIRPFLRIPRNLRCHRDNQNHLIL